jgi:hypothetical protein
MHREEAVTGRVRDIRAAAALAQRLLQINQE